MSRERPNNKFTTQQVIAAIRETKGLVTRAAARLGCDPKTIRSYAARYPTVAEALREEREGMTDVAELALYNAILKGEPWAVSLYLKTQGKQRGYVERVETTGKDGGPIEARTKVTHDFDFDAYGRAFADFLSGADGAGDAAPDGAAEPVDPAHPD